MQELKPTYPLNKITFEIKQLRRTPYVEIFIDNRSLNEIVSENEFPFVGKSTITSYAGLYPDIALLPSRHLLDQPNPEYLYEGEKVSVLECGCRFSGCWPFALKITIKDKFVFWSDFENPNQPEWDYEELPTFCFDKTQYQKALAKDPKYFRKSN